MQSRQAELQGNQAVIKKLESTLPIITKRATALKTLLDKKLGSEHQELIYKVKLLMNKSTLMVDQQEVQLIPGMAVTAEVMTGKRRLIEYVMAPLLRYKQESVRER